MTMTKAAAWAHSLSLLLRVHDREEGEDGADEAEAAHEESGSLEWCSFRPPGRDEDLVCGEVNSTMRPTPQLWREQMAGAHWGTNTLGLQEQGRGGEKALPGKILTRMGFGLSSDFGSWTCILGSTAHTLDLPSASTDAPTRRAPCSP